MAAVSMSTLCLYSNYNMKLKCDTTPNLARFPFPEGKFNLGIRPLEILGNFKVTQCQVLPLENLKKNTETVTFFVFFTHSTCMVNQKVRNLCKVTSCDWIDKFRESEGWWGDSDVRQFDPP